MKVAKAAEQMMELNGSYRAYIRNVVSGFENPLDVILREIESYEESGTFQAISLETSADAGDLGSYISLNEGRDKEKQN